MKEMGLHATDTERSVFAGEYEFKGKKVWMLLLAYVGDLTSDECLQRSRSRCVPGTPGTFSEDQVTGILSRDEKIDFLRQSSTNHFDAA